MAASKKTLDERVDLLEKSITRNTCRIKNSNKRERNNFYTYNCGTRNIDCLNVISMSNNFEKSMQCQVLL